MPKRTTGQRLLFVCKIALSLAAVWCLWIFLAEIFDRTPKNGDRSACQSNLKQIMLGVLQYNQDYDNTYPRTATSLEGWAEVLQPYLKSTQIYQCPKEPNVPNADPPNPAQPQYIDYWYNSRLSGKLEKRVAHPSNTIALGDGNDGADNTNSTYALRSIPKAWNQTTSPLYRHLDGMNLAFADGHVKWIAAKSWKSGLAVDDYVFKIGK
jgi:prepilin-type processing-associated H-X9-DG protein